MRMVVFLQMTSLTGRVISTMFILILMAIHAPWATVVLVRRSEKWIEKFHKFSLVVWGIRLVPYLLGVALNMKF